MSLYQEYKSSLKLTSGEEIFDLLIYRLLAFILVKGISSTGITPNQITFVSFLSFLAAGIFVSTGTTEAVLMAGLFIGIGNVMDCADGQLARVNKSGTELGRILDGVGDYLSATALLIGIGFWGSSLSYTTFAWIGLIIITALSYAWQASLVDYYRNEFFSHYEGKDNFVDDEINSSKEKIEKLKSEKGSFLKRLALSAYVLYSTIQIKVQPRPLNIDNSHSDQYIKDNLFMLRLWCLNGTSTTKTIALLCCLFNRLDLFLIIVLVFGTAFSLTLLIFQKRVDKKLLMSVV